MLALLLSLAAALGGMVIGLGLRPPAAEPPGGAGLAAIGTDPAAPGAELANLQRAVAQEQARLESLARTRAAAEAEFQARLDALARARSAAEAQLAAVHRDLAAAQREPGTAPPARRDAAPPAATAAPPRPPRLEASSGQPRVFIHHRAGSNGGAEAAAALVGPLREGGFDVPELRAVPTVPSQRVVRYFHADDAATAARLAGRLGRGWAIQDFRGFDPAPAPGTLEVWVPDR